MTLAATYTNYQLALEPSCTKPSLIPPNTGNRRECQILDTKPLRSDHKTGHNHLKGFQGITDGNTRFFFTHEEEKTDDDLDLDGNDKPTKFATLQQLTVAQTQEIVGACGPGLWPEQIL